MKLTFATPQLRLLWPDSQIWGGNYSKYSLNHITRMLHASFLIVPIPNCPRTLEAFSSRSACFQTPGKSELPSELNQFTAGFHPTAVQFLLLPYSVTVEHALQFVNLPLLLTMVHWLVHNSSRVEATEKGWLVQAVLWWLPPWEPKQRRAVCQSLFPTHALQAVWLRQDSSYSCTWYQLFPFPLHPAGYLNLILMPDLHSVCPSWWVAL